MTGVLLTHVLGDAVEGGNYGILNKNLHFTAVSSQIVESEQAAEWAEERLPENEIYSTFIESGTAPPDHLYFEELPLDIVDDKGGWTLWAARSDFEFHDRSDVTGAKSFKDLAQSVAILLTLGLLGFVFFASRAELIISKKNSLLEASESKVRAIVEGAADGIVAFLDDGTILSANPAAERIFDRAKGSLAGVNFQDCVPSILELIKSESQDGDSHETLGYTEDGSFAIGLAVSRTRLEE